MSTDSSDDPLWYKDAVIYQLHVRSFFDQNDDGVGDFSGLTSKLDYIERLGVSAIWLLPFYPSPMRDDGYDIADYLGINPVYGTQRDFQTFVRAAHERGLKIITELVVNHTSDQHPWFQAARTRAARLAEARALRLERHGQALSRDADHLHGHRAVELGLGPRRGPILLAPLLLAPAGLEPQQPGRRERRHSRHAALARSRRRRPAARRDSLSLRARRHDEREPAGDARRREAFPRAVDAKYKNRMLLAEANQWPEDVRDYFGDGDECHMAYHFPLMPRMYMAIAQEDRYPIVEILQQTPDIPPTCQWAIFLRNHDELTLEMVTDKERDYMYQMYAADPRARVNVGIRRRLAPLMENDPAKIQLMNSLLFSMPGSPTVYYGDELGMGDNIYLGDRNSVRTPMQWSPDRNGGFSRADPQSLYLPPIMDPVYGYASVNVEAQSREPSSLLNWTRRMLAVRKALQGVRPRHVRAAATRATARSSLTSAATRIKRSSASRT